MTKFEVVGHPFLLLFYIAICNNAIYKGLHVEGSSLFQRCLNRVAKLVNCG